MIDGFTASIGRARAARANPYPTYNRRTAAAAAAPALPAAAPTAMPLPSASATVKERCAIDVAANTAQRDSKDAICSLGSHGATQISQDPSFRTALGFLFAPSAFCIKW